MGRLFEGAPTWFTSTVKSARLLGAPDWFSRDVLGSGTDQEEDESVVEARVNRVEDEGFESVLLSQIRRREAGRWGYDSWAHRGSTRSPTAPVKPLTQLTVDEVLEWQRNGGSAAGGYQIIRTTLTSAKRFMGLTGAETFDRDMQDRIARDYLLRGKRRVPIDKFLSGKATREAFANDLAREWAALPVVTPQVRKTKGGNINISPGQSFYRGVSTNKALFGVDEYLAIFDLAEVQEENKEK
jgi:hypothetical protein